MRDLRSLAKNEASLRAFTDRLIRLLALRGLETKHISQHQSESINQVLYSVEVQHRPFNGDAFQS